MLPASVDKHIKVEKGMNKLRAHATKPLLVRRHRAQAHVTHATHLFRSLNNWLKSSKRSFREFGRLRMRFISVDFDAEIVSFIGD